MTATEVAGIVKDEIVGRWPKASDAVRGDWNRAIWAAGSIARAQEIIHFLVDHDVKLSVGAFYDRIWELKKAERVAKQGTPDERPLVWTPWVRCLEPPVDQPKWRDREWLRCDGLAACDRSNHPRVAQFAHDKAVEISVAYGGQWTGIVRPVGQRPEAWPELEGELAQEWIDAHILEGPDGPSRRFVERMMKSKEKNPVAVVAGDLSVRDEPGSTESDMEA